MACARRWDCADEQRPGRRTRHLIRRPRSAAVFGPTWGGKNSRAAFNFPSASRRRNRNRAQFARQFIASATTKHGASSLGRDSGRRLPRLPGLGRKRDEASFDLCFLNNAPLGGYPQLENPTFPHGCNYDAAWCDLL